MDAPSDKSPIPNWLRQPAALGLLAGAGLILVVGLTIVHIVVGLAAAALVLVGAIFLWRGICQAWDQAELRRSHQEQVLRVERQRLEKDLEAAANALRQEQDGRATDRTRADENTRQLQSESQGLANRIQKLEAEESRRRSEFEQERSRLRQEAQKASARLQQVEESLKQAREEGQRALREAQEKAERVLKQTREEANRAMQEMQRQRAEELQAAADRLNQEWRSSLDQGARPPLTALVGFAQLLEIDALSPEQLHNVQQILKGSRHILGWIDQRLEPPQP